MQRHGLLHRHRGGHGPGVQPHQTQSQGGSGRENTNKIVVLLTDGQPNLQQSTNTTISNYINANPNTWTNPTTGQTINNWTVTGSYQIQQQAGLMQTSIMQSQQL